MRVLFIHTFYQLKGGEDSVFFQERDLISKSAEVSEVLYYNRPGWRGGLQFFFSIWNILGTKKIKRAIAQFKPDIIHIHNLHFASGPLVIRAAKKAGIPVVVTLHNFRLLCPSATLFFKGHLFMHSVKKAFPWQAVKNGVYRQSVLQTFWLALITWFHKKIGTWKTVDKFIVLTEFARSQFLNSSLGIPESKFTIKPNFLEKSTLAGVVRDHHFLYVGRLSDEKGIDVLLNAFKNSPYKLSIAGVGPLIQNVENVRKHNANISYLGALNAAEVQKELLECSALIVPSICFEGMPLTILEAFATATPVITSNIGAMATMITDGYNGLHFEANNPIDMMDKVKHWVSLSEKEKNKYADNAKKSYLENYTPEENIDRLIEIYNSIMM
jgi:glycosyltransferase involved in cell wall biosynthesis